MTKSQVQENYAGALRDTPTKVKRRFCANESCIPRICDTYKARGLVKTIPQSKVGHLDQSHASGLEWTGAHSPSSTHPLRVQLVGQKWFWELSEVHLQATSNGVGVMA